MNTTRCRIEIFNKDDISCAVRLYTDENVRKHLGGVVDEATAREKISKWVNSNNIYFSVKLYRTGEFMGMISVGDYYNDIDQEISYMFLPEYWGNGFAFESISYVMEYCRSEMKLNRLIAETQAANTASCRLLERLGYVLSEQVTRYGELQNVYVYDFVRK